MNEDMNSFFAKTGINMDKTFRAGEEATPTIYSKIDALN